MALNGISALIGVARMKSAQANDEALVGANKQKDLIEKMKTIRKAKRDVEAAVSNEVVGNSELAKMGRSYDAAVDAGLGYTWNKDLFDTAGADTHHTNEVHVDEDNGDLRNRCKDNKAIMDQLMGAYDDMLEDLEAADDMGNFEIQDLMSNYNQAETLASSVQKKLDDASNAVISKV